MKKFVIEYDWLVTGLVVGILASILGFKVVMWQWWAFVIPMNTITMLLISHFKRKHNVK